MRAAENYMDLKRDVEKCCVDAGRASDATLLLAVSKTVGVDEVKQVFDAGCRDFGENRPEGLIEKSQAFPEARWHFIGNIQSRRIKDIVRCAHLIHSVYKAEHLPRIDAAAREVGKIQKILIEVNVSGEESKSGVEPAQLNQIYSECLTFENIDCEGLMTMAPLGDLDEAKECFEGLHELEEQLSREFGQKHEGGSAVAPSQLSMGMTDDWRIAVEKGSTIVRLGRAIFS